MDRVEIDYLFRKVRKHIAFMEIECGPVETVDLTLIQNAATIAAENIGRIVTLIEEGINNEQNATCS